MVEKGSGRKHIELASNVLIEPYLIIGFVGLAFHFAWVFVMYATQVLMPISLYTEAQTSDLKLVLMISITLSYILGWAFCDALFSRRTLLVALVILLGTACIWPRIIPQIMEMGYLIYLFWIMTGVGYAISFLLWSEFLSSINISKNKAIIAGSLLCGALLAWILFAMSPPISFFLAIGLVVLTAALIGFLDSTWKSLHDRVKVTRRESDKRQKLTLSPVVSTWASSIAFGFVLNLNLTMSSSRSYVTTMLVIAFAIACILTLYDSTHANRIDEDIIIKIFLPTAAVGLFSMVLFSETVFIVIICCAIMVFGLALQMISGLSALSGHINLYRLAPMRVFGYGRAATAFGLSLGWLFGGISQQRAIFGDTALVVVAVVIMTMFIFIASFVMENHYPAPPEGTMSSQSSVEGTCKEGDDDEALDSLRNNSKEATERGIWRRRCEAVADYYDLSPRQREVLILLAKGRNAEYIQEQLVVSNHTAKAHIYNIYQKTNVHSRQELIDLIERIDLS